jgi:hypothetical protein
MKPTKLLTIITLVLIVLFSGCKKDTFLETPGLCPLVVSTDPVNLAISVPLNKVITATFNENMNPLTVTPESFTLETGAKGMAPVAGAVSCNGAVVTFTPSASLQANTTYTGTLKHTIKDTKGNSLQEDYVWTFSTGQGPLVSSTNPANNATNVVLNKIVTALFSKPVDPLTVTGTTFTLMNGTTPVAGAVTYSGSTATFTPTANLAPGTTYTGTITTGVKDLDGNPIQSNFVWTFITGSPPTVLSTSPITAATNVVLNKVVTAIFNVPVDPLTITGTTFTLRDGVNPVAGSVSYTGSTASFIPTENLNSGTLYTATLTTGVKNLFGIPMAANYVWTFTTGTTTAPLVISTDPADTDIGVLLNKVVTATFSTPMDPLTITGTTFTLKQGATAVPGAVTYTGSTATFTPTANLSAGLLYTATITTGVKDVPGVPLVEDYIWTFTTISSGAPTVVSTDPVNAATGVALNKVLSANFSVPMSAATITTATFTLKQGATPIAGTVAYSGSTATFTPTASLVAGTVYTATITTGAQNVLLTPLAADYVWTFTTGNLTAPTVTSVVPLNSSTGVPVNTVLTANFSVPMDPLTITSTTFTLKRGTVDVAGAISYSGSAATFTPTSNLLSGTVYTATVTTGAKNVAGTPLAANYVWTFTTVAIAPTVISTIPLNNATGVAANLNLSATFSVPMDASTITGTTFTLMEGLNSVVGVVTYAGSTATFNPNVDLLSGTVYTATITTGAKNVAGTALAANKVWTFTTAIIPPTVTGVTPLSGATGVSETSLVTATFSVPMDPLTITGSTFTVLQGVTPVAGVVTYSGSTATFTPSANLMSGSTFTATITTGAKNPAGTALANNYVWSFSTGAKGPGIVDLGTAGNFVIIGKTGISTTGTTAITGDIGVSPAAASFITGFGLVMDVSNTFATTVPTTLVTGKVYASDYTPPTPAYMTQAVSDMETALTTAMGLTTTVIVDLGAGDISGMTLAPGLYKYNTGLLITASGVTLSGGPADTWVFQISSDLTVDNGALITLAGGALAKNIFWVTNTQAVLGTGVDFKGNILGQTLISLNTGAKVLGRLLSQTAVTLNAATVIKP